MTREEIMQLNTDYLNGCESEHKMNELFSYALEQQPCGDAISRQAVLDMLEDINAETEGVGFYYEHYVEYIKNLPPVTPQQKYGKWIRWYEQKENDWCIENIPHCKCSECGKEYDPHSSQFIKYCNECGAKMQESEEV